MKTLILAGGGGTRLWPLSREDCPKQFVCLPGMEHTLFQQALLRALLLCAPEDIYIVAHERYAPLIREQTIRIGVDIPPKHIITEPMTKNTLPAIVSGIKSIRHSGEDIVAVLPSDHVVGDPHALAEAVKAGLPLTHGHIVTFGIRPSWPSTGYGYIQPGVVQGSGHNIAAFHEKPEADIANRYIASGCLWNSGMFLFDTGLFMDEVHEQCPEVYNAFMNADICRCFEQSPAISIDCGIMEKSRRAAVVPLDCKWNDLGGYAAIASHYGDLSDAEGNIAPHCAAYIEGSNNLICAQDVRTVVIGVDDLVIALHDGALLICHKDRLNDIPRAARVLDGI